MTKQVVFASKEQTLQAAAKMMYEKRIGSVVVRDESGRCIGILTERDFLRFFALGIPGSATVGEHMTKNPITIRESATINEAKNIMTTQRIRHLPIVDKDGIVVGIISVRDIYERIETFI